MIIGSIVIAARGQTDKLVSLLKMQRSGWKSSFFLPLRKHHLCYLEICCFWSHLLYVIWKSLVHVRLEESQDLRPEYSSITVIIHRIREWSFFHRLQTAATGSNLPTTSSPVFLPTQVIVLMMINWSSHPPHRWWFSHLSFWEQCRWLQWWWRVCLKHTGSSAAGGDHWVHLSSLTLAQGCIGPFLFVLNFKSLIQFLFFFIKLKIVVSNPCSRLLWNICSF